MTLDEAITKAKTTHQPLVNGKDVFEVSFDIAETAQSYVGKTLKAGTKTIEIIQRAGQNYVMCVNGEYGISPVLHVLQGVKHGKITEA